MKIAVCDDEPAELQKLYLQLQQYIKKRNTDAVFETFAGGAALVDAIDGGAVFDLIFLDVMMPGITGIETAREIRLHDKKTVIVFLTGSPNFALESYSVRARHYLVKPCEDETLFTLMDEIVSEIAGEEGRSFLINTKTGLRRVRTDKLEYCEILNHTIRYHIANGMTYEGSGNLSELQSELLAYSCFLRFHRSYIVNMNYIARIDSKNLDVELISSVRLPIPKAKPAEVREAFVNWSENKRG